jgi:lipid-A-disaccharide synthase
MGFVEVLLNLRTIVQNIKFCKKDIEAYQPDALVLIDYPGFNMRMAAWAKSKGIRVFYYISPQIWAWKQNRGYAIKKTVDELYCILPFEKDFYKKFDLEANFVGHPLLDAIDNFYSESEFAQEKKPHLSKKKRPILALLPGSRNQEIQVKLPLMLQAASKFKDQYEIVLGGAPNKNEDFYKPLIGSHEIRLVFNQTYDLLAQADLALVTSGTATLETALFQVPQVVCYKGSRLSYMIAKQLIKIKFISLVNLIMDKEVVKELIQDECTVENMVRELKRIQKGEERNHMLAAYEQLSNQLGGSGASERTAIHMLKSIR